MLFQDDLYGFSLHFQQSLTIFVISYAKRLEIDLKRDAHTLPTSPIAQATNGKKENVRKLVTYRQFS